MNRRNFLGAATFMAPLSAVKMWPAGNQSLRKRYGFLDVDGHRAHLRLTGENLHVLFQGKDITKNCVEVDDVEGYAVVMCRDEQQHRDWAAQGHIHVRGNGSCQMRLTGDILIVPGE